MNKQRLFFKKASALVLCTILLFTCSACFNISNTPKPDSSTGQTFNGQYAETDNEAFAQYVNELFAETVTTDTVTLHSYMEHPQDFGIDNYAVTLGRYDLDALDNTSDITGKLTALKSFDRKTLSQKQQITYDELLIYLQNELEYSDLYLFHTDLCTTTGFHVQFPLILAEYTFEEEKDVKEYLALLEDSDGYFQSLTDYETLRSQNGYFMEDALATQIVGECENFIESAGSPDSYLITTFDEKLDALTGISDADKAAYKTANQAAVTGHLIKGYRILTDGLKKLTGTNRCQGGLCNYPDGEKYFQYLLNHSLGWSKTVDEYNALLDSYIRSNLLTMQTLMTRDSTLAGQFDSFSFSITEPAAILTDLKTKIAADFPQGPDVFVFGGQDAHGFGFGIEFAFVAVPQSGSRQAGGVIQLGQQISFHSQGFFDPGNDGFPVEVGVGDGGEQVHGHQMVHIPADGFAGGTQGGGHSGQALGGVDQQILHGSHFRLLAADPHNGAAFAAGSFLTLITEHLVFHWYTPLFL